MMNILLFVHVVIACLLIIVILLQKTGADSIGGIGGGNMGVVSARSAANFLTKTTVILASLFFINAIILANLSSRKVSHIDQTIEQMKKIDSNALPIAK